MNREDFPILSNNLVYLDNGATTLKPKVVIDKITEYYSSYSWHSKMYGKILMYVHGYHS